MEASSVLSSYAASPSFYAYHTMKHLISYNSHFISSNYSKPHLSFVPNSLKTASFSNTCVPKWHRLHFSCPRSSLVRPWALTTDEVVEKNGEHSVPASGPSNPKEMLPRIDKSGRFCSPRAARELALMILYASCLEGSDPVRLFEKRLNARRESGYEFEKASLSEYNHMSFGGPPVTTETIEEADELLRKDEKESEIEAEVLSAPPKLVYSKLILHFTRKLLVAVVEKWNSHVLVINKVAPDNWKSEPAGRILELSILHLAMSEIAVLGTRHQIVINEAVDLAKRFCDGAAPRIINGCLRIFMKDINGNYKARDSKSNRLNKLTNEGKRFVAIKFPSA